MIKSEKTILVKLLILAFLVCSCADGTETPSRGGDIENVARTALDAMKELQRNGGWAMAWAEDGSAAFGEWLLREDDIITVQPPATPGIGMTFLRAYQVLDDSVYLDAAVSAGDALINGQLSNGGFPQEFYPDLRRQDSSFYEDANGNLWVPRVPGADIFLERESGTFDDETTQYATEFLLNLGEISGHKRFTDAANRAVRFMLEAQYPNGGWPQKYPLQDNYTRFITLNDAAMMDVIRILFKYGETTGDSVVFEAAVRGADFLLELQNDPPQAGWAQQYTKDGDPASARPWEPVALSSAESVEVLEALKDVYLITGDKKYLEAGEKAFEWLLNSQLENSQWARFYEIGTNRPVYSGKDEELTYNYEEALRYHPDYSWQGDYFDSELREFYQQLLEVPATERMELVSSEPKSKKSVGEEAFDAANSLNSNGFWAEEMEGETVEFYRAKFGEQRPLPNLIHSGDFVSNMNSLLEYIAQTRTDDS